MFYDLTDPTTKALYDSYTEDEKQYFESACLYMKYVHELVAVGLGRMANVPPAPELAKLDPEIRKKLDGKWKIYEQVALGGTETDQYH
jgi:hypothetical protein